MDEKGTIPQQTPEQREELREMANRCEDASGRLAEHGVVFGVSYRCNAEQPDGSVVDGLSISRSLSAELALMEMMADWYDAKKKAIEFGVLDLQNEPVN
tara:strand:- start:272 stop:568 length:297 start_codon:yes stop_codon:yes gene_type:complete